MSGTVTGINFIRVNDDIVMEVYRGKTINAPITWPSDVTGYTASMVLRSKAGDVMLTMSTSNGKATVGGVDGIITFTGTVADSIAVKSDGLWEIELIAPDGSVYGVGPGPLVSKKKVA